jgi:hypothetical protein
MLRFCSYAFDKAKAASKYRVLLDDDRTFADDEKDTDLFERIWAKQLPGVLNHGNRGYKRLLERGTKFNRPTAVEKAARLSPSSNLLLQGSRRPRPMGDRAFGNAIRGAH